MKSYTALPRTILYVHASDELYGADVILLSLVQQLDKSLFRPIVVLPTDVPYQGLLSRKLRESGIGTVHLKLAVLRRKYFTPIGMLIYFWRLIVSTIALIRLIRREAVRIVHTNTSAVIPGALAARLTGTPHVWHVHEIIVRPRFLWRSTSWLLPRLSKYVVAVSEATLHHLCAGDRLNAQQGLVIHNGIDTARFDAAATARQSVRAAWGVGPHETLVGMIGRFSPWKGQSYLLQVAALVRQQRSNVRFALVGGTFPGQEQLVDQAQALAANLQLSPDVIFDGFRSDSPAVLAAYDIFVMPSTLPDPFPTVVLEAMASRKPVVANAHGGSVEMVSQGQTGFLVEVGNPEAMAAAIVSLLDRPDEQAAMGVRARERLDAQFSLTAFVETWTDLYRRIAGAHN